MADDHVYGEVNNKTNLRTVFGKIRKDVAAATTRDGLTELYRRAGYLVTLSHAKSWEKKFGEEIGAIREVAEQQFRTTAKAINTRAKTIGVDADYDDTWGKNKKASKS